MGMSTRHFTVKDGGKLALDMHRIEAVMQSEISGKPVTLIVTGTDTYGVTERYEFILAAWADATRDEDGLRNADIADLSAEVKNRGWRMVPVPHAKRLGKLDAVAREGFKKGFWPVVEGDS